VARGATSLITPVVVTGEGWTLSERVTGRRVTAGDPVLRIEVAGPAVVTGIAGEAASRTIRSPLPHGLHARPAARVASAAGAHRAQVSLQAGDRTASASSPVAMMALGLREGDALTLSASGPGAEAAVAALAELILSGMGEKAGTVHAAPPPRTPSAGPVEGDGGELVFSGACAARGWSSARRGACG
jgi:phosphotransferase system HPr (HPr) family protein